MKPRPVTLEAVAAGSDEALWRRLKREGRAAYRVEARAAETRSAARRRTHLQSAKILDRAGAFLCEATILDMSDAGLRLQLVKSCGLPARFGVHVDLTGEVLTAAPAWRRGLMIGARVIAQGPPAPLKTSDRAALAGRYYGVKG